jgi:hypothetical protein
MASDRATELSGLMTIRSVHPLASARLRATISTRRPEESQNVVPVMSTMTRPGPSSTASRLALMAAEFVMSISPGSDTMARGPTVSSVTRPTPGVLRSGAGGWPGQSYGVPAHIPSLSLLAGKR